MPFLGTIINFIGVLIFGVLGAFVKKGIPKHISDAVITGMAICVIYVGIDGVIESAPAVPEGAFLSAGLVKILIMILSMAIGTLIGELVDFDRLVNKLGDMLEVKLSRFSQLDSKGNFAKGFVSCSLLFCVGAMAVNGALQDGMGNPDILLAKTVIDAITCFVMATTLGIGCAFSAFFLLAYQGVLAVLGYFLASIIPAATVSYMSITGSLIIILIGTNVLGITRVKTANMVPAIFIPILLAPLFELIL
jgi:uncharacterized membrane protein YqgA involved in biofilm formation